MPILENLLKSKPWAPRQVVILRGIPGRGKTTFARKNYPAAVFCSADDFMYEGAEYKFRPALLGQNHSLCLSKYIEALTQGAETIVVDNTNVRVWEYDNYVKIAEMAGYNITIIQLSTPPDICLARQVHDVPRITVENMFHSWEFDPRAVSVFEFERSKDE